MTLIRIWRTQLADDRVDDYERFAKEQSLPMFKAQLGFMGVLFARCGTEAAVVTLCATPKPSQHLTPHRPTSVR